MSGKHWTVDWQSSDNAIIGDLTVAERSEFLKCIPDNINAHLFIKTSGSTGEAKWVVLSKAAMLTSAQEVNAFIQVSSKDVWLSCLPSYLMGGLAILARSHLSHSKVVLFEESWHPMAFIKQLGLYAATLTSLVPTQVFDLVSLGLPAPTALRAVFVGGGALNENLYKRARQLQWPLLPTYGLTETSSQVATVAMESLKDEALPELQILPHWQVEVNSQKNIVIAGPSLFSGYIEKNSQGLYNFRQRNGAFVTEDQGEIYLSEKMKKSCLKIGGRNQQIKKVRGVLVNSYTLNQRWQEQYAEGEIALLPDSRSENVVALILDKMPGPQLLTHVEKFNNNVGHAEKITIVYKFNEVPRTSTGKLKTFKR